MKWLDKITGGLRNVFGRSEDPAPKVTRTTMPWRPAPREDQGPADVAYLRRKFPRAIFTQRMTPARVKTLREVFARLRVDQQQIVLRRRWDKGFCDDLIKTT